MSEDKFSAKIPQFDGQHYDHWSEMMENLLRAKGLWSLIENGVQDPTQGTVATSTQTGQTTQGRVLTDAQKEQLQTEKTRDHKVKHYLFRAINRIVFEQVLDRSTSKSVWDSLKRKYGGNDRVKKHLLNTLRREFEVLEMKEGETITEYFSRVMVVANKMRSNGEVMLDGQIVQKVLRTLTDKFTYVVISIEESKDTGTMSVDELQSSLVIHEQKFKGSNRDNEQVLKVEDHFSGRGRGRTPFRGRGRGRGRQSYNKATVECYKCHNLGHFQYECPKWNKEANFAQVDAEEDLLLMAYEEKHDAKRSDAWFIDSGCSNHMCGDRGMFTNLVDVVQHSVKCGNNTRMSVAGKGSVKLVFNGTSFVVNDVYYVPDLDNNLLSVGQLQEKGVDVLMHNGLCKIYHPDKGLIACTKMSANRMFILLNERTTASTQLVENCLHTSSLDSTYLWHQRYGHLSYKGLRTLSAKGMVEGLPDLAASNFTCTDCFTGKQHRNIIPSSSKWRASSVLELIHADICGPIEPATNSGKRYILCFIDDFSRKSWAYLLVVKSEALQCFKKFKLLVEKKSGKSIKCLRTDRGGEFTSTDFKYFCEEHGIRRQLTTAYSPHQNGVAERKNRTVMNMVRCMLVAKKMPKSFWGEAVMWTFYLLNRCPTVSVLNKTPQEAWSGKKPSVADFRVWGCIAHAHVPDAKRRKLDDKSSLCILLGKSDESTGYRLYNPKTREIVVSKDVVFEEDRSWEWDSNYDEQIRAALEWGDSDYSDEESDEENEVRSGTENESGRINDVENGENSSQVSRTHGRESRQPTWMSDYVNGDELSEEEAEAYMVQDIISDDPSSFEEAIKHEKWRKAMNSEINSIEKNKTWELVDLPEGARTIGVKWIYKTKFNEVGQVDKYKARLVAKGYSQQRGIDFSETFAPVTRMETVRMILALAAFRGWEIFQMDVKSAFLHGELCEDVYVEQPKGYVKKGEESKVYKLYKALYGLRQAPRAWFSRIESHFLSEGFQRCPNEQTLFIKRSSEGIEVLQNSEGIFICQRRYTSDILKKFAMSDSKPVNTPLVPGFKLNRDVGGKAVDDTCYKQIVGSLMYLTATRPDIMFSVSLISRYMSRPTELHLQAAKRILRYLNGTTGYGIFYKKKGDADLLAFTDSDYAGDEEDSKSTSGYVFMLSSGAVSWMSKKQPIVTLSTTEAEYVAAVANACQAVWMRRVLKKLSHDQKGSTTIMCDNTSTINLSKNPVLHGRSKHIRVRFHYLRELARDGEVELVHCGTQEQVADLMTKALKIEAFQKLRNKMGVINYVEVN